MADPEAVAAIVAVAGMPQAARMRVHHPNDGQAFVLLADHPAAKGLGFAVEADMDAAGAASCAGWQCSQDVDFVLQTQAKQHPADFLVTPAAGAVGGEFVEERLVHLIRDDDSLQPTVLVSPRNG